jgi:hypothetical protein
MRGRTKLAVLAATAVAGAGIAAGAVAATSGSDDQAADLASAINKRAGTSITADDVEGAFQDVLKQHLDEAVAAGKITQAEADRILAQAKNGGLPGGAFLGPPAGGRGMVFGFHGPGLRAGVLAAAAKLLGTTEADLRAKIEKGATLSSLAKAKGVTKADLVAAIQNALRAADPDLTAARAKAMATRIADGLDHRRHGPPGPPVDILGPVAALLKTTEADLREKLEDGASLTSIAKDAGVSRDDLVATIEKALTTAKPAIPADRVDDLAAHIADETGHEHGPGPGGPGPWGPGPAGP